jgi:hypothetical protein
MTEFVLRTGGRRNHLGDGGNNALAILLFHLIGKLVQPIQDAVPEPAPLVCGICIDLGLLDARNAADVPVPRLTVDADGFDQKRLPENVGVQPTRRSCLFSQRTNMRLGVRNNGGYPEYYTTMTVATLLDVRPQGFLRHLRPVEFSRRAVR